MLGNFACFLSFADIFLINFFIKFFQEHYQSVRLFGSRSRLTLCPNCLQRLSAYDKSPCQQEKRYMLFFSSWFFSKLLFQKKIQENNHCTSVKQFWSRARPKLMHAWLGINPLNIQGAKALVSLHSCRIAWAVIARQFVISTKFSYTYFYQTNLERVLIFIQTG